MLTARRLTMACTAAATVGLIAATPAFAATSATVTTPGDDAESGADWYFSSVHTNEAGVGGPTGGEGGVEEAPAGGDWGAHSYELAVDDATEKARLMTDMLDGTPLSNLDGAGYSVYTVPGTDAMKGYGPAINVIIDPAGEDDFATLVWEANKAGIAVADESWQDWDTTDGTGWWSPSIANTTGLPGANNKPTTLDVLAAHFGEESEIIGFAVNVGRHGPLTAYVDGIGITVDGETRTFDVEPAVRLAGKADCKDGGWATSTDPVFRNQGDCVSSFASPKAKRDRN